MPRRAYNNTGKPPGRPKGSQAKETKDFKVQLNKLFEWSAPRMADWLEEIAKEDPKHAFEILWKFSEFLYPKLSRKEVDLEARVEDISAKLAQMEDPANGLQQQTSCAKDKPAVFCETDTAH